MLLSGIITTSLHQDVYYFEEIMAVPTDIFGLQVEVSCLQKELYLVLPGAQQCLPALFSI